MDCVQTCFFQVQNVSKSMAAGASERPPIGEAFSVNQNPPPRSWIQGRTNEKRIWLSKSLKLILGNYTLSLDTLNGIHWTVLLRYAKASRRFLRP